MGNSSKKEQVQDLKLTKPVYQKFTLDKCNLDESNEEIEEIDEPEHKIQETKTNDVDTIDHTLRYQNPYQNKQNLERQNSEHLSLSFAPTLFQSLLLIKKHNSQEYAENRIPVSIRFFTMSEDCKNIIEIKLTYQMKSKEPVGNIKKLIYSKVGEKNLKNMIYDIEAQNNLQKEIENTKFINDNLPIELYGMTPNFIVSSKLHFSVKTFLHTDIVLKRITSEVNDLKSSLGKKYGLSAEEIIVDSEGKDLVDGMLIQLYNSIENRDGDKKKIEKVWELKQIKVDFKEKIQVTFLFNNKSFVYEISPKFSILNLKKLMEPILGIDFPDQNWTLIEPEERNITSEENQSFFTKISDPPVIKVESKRSLEEIKYFIYYPSQNIEDYGESCLEIELIQFYQELEKINKLSSNFENFELTLIKLKKIADEDSPYSKLLTNHFKDLMKINENEEVSIAKKIVLEMIQTISPINLSSLSIKLNENLEYAKMKVKGKKIFVFLGPTGSGKSTLICYLNQCKMIAGKLFGIEVEENSSPNPPCKIGSTIHSETKGFQPIDVPLPDGVETSLTDYLILCDTAGFGDTGGPHVDLLNSLSIAKGIQMAEEFKPIIVINKFSVGELFQGVVNLIKHLIKLLRSSYNLSKCEFFFVGFDENEENGISDKLTKLAQNIEEANIDKKNILVEVINDMKKKFKIIHPLLQKPCPKEIINEWMKFDTTFISHPDENFHIEITPKTFSIIMNQIALIKEAIEYYLPKKNAEMINFKLDEIKKFHKLLCIPELKRLYNECLQLSSNTLNSYIKIELESFIEKIGKNTLLSESEIKQFFEFSFITRWETVRKNHLKNDLITINGAKVDIKTLLEEKSKIFERKDFLEDEELNMLQNIDLIILNVPNFDEIKKMQEENIKIIRMLFFRQNELLKNYLEEEKLVEVVMLVKKIENLKKKIENFAHSDLFAIITIYNNIEELHAVSKANIKDFYMKFQYRSQELMNEDENLNFQKIKSTFEEIAVKIQKLALVENFKEMETIINLSFFKDIKTSILELANDFISKNIRQSINEALKNSDNFQQISSLLPETKNILVIANEIKKTSLALYNIIKPIFSDIKNFIKLLEDDVKKVIKDLRENKEIIDYRCLNKALKFIKNNEDVINEIIPSSRYSFLYIEEEIVEYFKEKQEEFAELSFDFKDHEALTEIKNFILNLFKIRRFENLYEKVSKYLEEVKKIFTNTIEYNSELIRQELAKINSCLLNDSEDFECMFKYIETLEIIIKNKVLFNCLDISSLSKKIINKSEFKEKMLKFLIMNQSKFFKDQEENFQGSIEYLRTLKKLLGMKTLAKELKIENLFQSCLSNLNRKRMNLEIELSEEIELFRINEINAKLVEINNLSQFDEFFENQKSFSLAYQSKSIIFKEEIKKKSLKLKESLKAGDYEDFKKNFEKFDVSQLKSPPIYLKSEIEEIIKNLRNNLQTLSKEAKDQLSLMNRKSITLEQLMSISTNLMSLMKAKLYVESIYDFREIWRNYEISEKAFFEIFEKKIVIIENLFKNFKYEKAETLLSEIESEDYLLLQLNENGFNEIKKKIENLRTMREDSFKKLKENLAHLTFNVFEYSISPKEMFEQLKKMNENYGEYHVILFEYANEWNKQIHATIEELRNKNDFFSLKILKDYLDSAPEWIKYNHQTVITEILSKVEKK